MDERIKQEYHRIYSELYMIILGVCCLSVIAKVMVFQKNIVDCGLEYLILIGSPIYRFVRCRMRNVVIPIEQKQWKLRFVSALAVVIVLFCITMYVRTGRIAIREMLSFLIPFCVIFLLVSGLSLAAQKRWQKKMEDKYRE